MRKTTQRQLVRLSARDFSLIARVIAILCLHSPTGLLAQQSSPSDQSSQQAASSAQAQDDDKAASSTEALQKATQNPVANLISVPIQNNTNFGVDGIAAGNQPLADIRELSDTIPKK